MFTCCTFDKNVRFFVGDGARISMFMNVSYVQMYSAELNSGKRSRLLEQELEAQKIHVDK